MLLGSGEFKSIGHDLGLVASYRYAQYLYRYEVLPKTWLQAGSILS